MPISAAKDHRFKPDKTGRVAIRPVVRMSITFPVDCYQSTLSGGGSWDSCLPGRNGCDLREPRPGPDAVFEVLSEGERTLCIHEDVSATPGLFLPTESGKRYFG